VDDFDARYRAVSSRDERFDGVFCTAVRTTGIYCRPSCPATTPLARNVEFHRTAASAEAAGFRACRRCRPDCTPGSPEWDVRADVVGRAVRLVRDGVVERDGVPGLARRLGYSERHVTRMITEELGVGPLALATSQRTRTARLLVETTDLSMADVAFASGFSSVRQFNDAFRAAFDRTPSEVRSRAGGAATAGQVLRLRLAVRRPFHAEALAGFLADHAVPGLERGDGRLFARVLSLPHGHGAAVLVLHDDHVDCRLELADQRDLTAAVARLRHLLDLDADPRAVDEALARPGPSGTDLRDLVARRPGLRVPGTVDAFETAVRTVVGQQVSVSGARTVIGRLLLSAGEPVGLALAAEHGLTHAFPTPSALAALDPETLPMPRSRGRTVVGLAHAVDAGDVRLDPGVDRDDASAALLALPGIGPWTVGYVRMRGLGDPDVLLDTDLVLRRILQARGATPDDARAWSPWRSYAGMHLWTEHLAVQARARTRGSRP
jgi:AraC family transcriptional regulator of adaptative response / DNA-3-methyladenine glycosylase II